MFEAGPEQQHRSQQTPQARSAAPACDVPTRHELLAPAGDVNCLRAAVNAGADAIYFGLAQGFNARAKAANFTVDELPSTLAYLHRYGVKGYITLNTLVFDHELATVRELIAAIAQAGADAVIVQDLAVVQLCRIIAPNLPVHASTQMTCAAPQTAALLAALGVQRIVLPRELSLRDIAYFRRHTHLELEAFVHGALCIAVSGQCLASHTWGERSANRGWCAQPCRQPYELWLDGKKLVSEAGYPLSPRDLAAHRLLPQLIAAGVTSLKIEGRYKGPEYVAAAVEKYRKVLDGLSGGREGAPHGRLSRSDQHELALTFSRQFCTGWLEGAKPHALVRGRRPGHHGLLVGEVVKIDRRAVWVRPVADAPTLSPGDWMHFEQAQQPAEAEPPRGGLFGLLEPQQGLWGLCFGNPGPDLTQVHSGALVWKAHDARLTRRLKRYVHAERDAQRRVWLDLWVQGALAQPLEVRACDALGRTATVCSTTPLEPAAGAGLSATHLREKLGGLGESCFALRHLTVELAGALHLGPGALKQLRRQLVAALEAAPPPPQTSKLAASLPGPLHQATPNPRHLHDADGANGAACGPAIVVLSAMPAPAERAAPTAPLLVPLCRTAVQVEAVLAAGVAELYVELPFGAPLERVAHLCRAHSARLLLVTPRLQTQGIAGWWQKAQALGAQGLLVRHLGMVAAAQHQEAASEAREAGPVSLHGDASLNVANAVAARTLLGWGLSSVTPAAEVDAAGLAALASQLDPAAIELVVQQHVPLWHSAHCLWQRHLTPGPEGAGVESGACDRACERHKIALRDRLGLMHRVYAHSDCRNTVFNGQVKQLKAAAVRQAVHLGVRRLRLELLEETAAQTEQCLAAYRRLF